MNNLNCIIYISYYRIDKSFSETNVSTRSDNIKQNKDSFGESDVEGNYEIDDDDYDIINTSSAEIGGDLFLSPSQEISLVNLDILLPKLDCYQFYKSTIMVYLYVY